MYHSVTFGDKNTWDDWRLIPTSRPLFNPPALKERYVDIPGADGLLDLSTIFVNRPIFSNRQGSLEFLVEDQDTPWEVIYSRIANYLHGRHHRAILEDDPNFFYEGRFKLNQWRSNPSFSTITIDYSVGPYKKSVIGTLDDWLWDTFDFEYGIIQDFKDMVVNGSLTIELIGLIQPVVPTFTTSEAMQVTWNDRTFPLPKGFSVVHDIEVREGKNVFTFTGNGTVSLEYRGGSL